MSATTPCCCSVTPPILNRNKDVSDKSGTVVRTPWSGRGEVHERERQITANETPRPDQGVRTTVPARLILTFAEHGKLTAATVPSRERFGHDTACISWPSTNGVPTRLSDTAGVIPRRHTGTAWPDFRSCRTAGRYRERAAVRPPDTSSVRHDRNLGSARQNESIRSSHSPIAENPVKRGIGPERLSRWRTIEKICRSA